jgi:hypothetical protein
LNQASMSLKAPLSNLRFLSQGVRLATQNNVLDALPRRRAGAGGAAGRAVGAAAPRAASPIRAPVAIALINPITSRLVVVT